MLASRMVFLPTICEHHQACPNRFTNQQNKTQITITLDPDVAEIFTTSEAVNNALRAILSAIPKKASK
ncbi:MAG: hypothetical protein ACHBN1_04785 [Heteroscytonema crispum UTEX LB 1556]